MVKRAIVMLLGILLFGPMAWAEDSKPATPPVRPDLSTYLDQLQVKLEHTAQRTNQPNATGTSVVGLRGSKQEPVSKQLYWKGKTGPQPVTPEEVKIFRTAIEQAKANKKDDAAANLKSFLEKYPKSGLRGDAEDTLKLLLASAPPAAKP
jgi:hypothetical protein